MDDDFEVEEINQVSLGEQPEGGWSPSLDGNTHSDQDDNYEVIFEEMERLKESESEARAEVLQLQNFLRQSRMLQKLREAVNKQKHDYKIDNLKQ